jgi:arylsulfatase A-like enzyme
MLMRFSKICPLAALALLALASWAEPLAAQQNSWPNFILCMADDQGWGDVAYNGHPQLRTPHLDAMAAEGLRLDRFYAAAPVCSPTRGSVLTGRHPNRFACFSWGHSLRQQERTLAELLQSHGYATGHFGKWHLGSVRDNQPDSPGQNGFDEWFSSPNFFENHPLMSHNGKVVATEGESSHVVVEAALEFARRATREKKPFLAVVWFGNPHTPHEALDEYLELYADAPPRLRHYLGEISGIDRAMGKLRAELRSLGIADNTLVWYTSDNGAANPGLTGGLSGKKGSLWEGGIRVPAVIEWPGRVAPRRSNFPCGTVDIFPTVAQLAGLKLPADRPLDGTSLRPLLDGSLSERPPLGFWVYPAAGRPVRSQQLLQQLAREQSGEAPATEPEMFAPVPYPASDQFPGHAAWIDGSYKLHKIPNQEQGFLFQLFDLAHDMEEKNDLAETNPQRVTMMRGQLESWQRSVIQSWKGADDRPADD